MSVGLLATLPVVAQPWSGAAGLEVRVTGDSGPIAGARVTLSFRDRVLPEEPPPVATDGNGRAVVLGLATGTWQAEIAHPDYMTYVAVVLLGAEGKPEVTAAFLEATETSIIALKARFARPRGPASPFLEAEPRRPEPTAVAPAAPASPQAAAQAEPTPEPAPTESVASAPTLPAPTESASAPPPPGPTVVAPAPPGPAAPVPAPREPEPPMSAGAPETTAPPPKPHTAPPGPPAVAPPEPPQAASRPQPPVQAPHPVSPPPPTPPVVQPPATVPTVEIPPAAAVPPAPAPALPAAAPLRSYAARTCFECKPSEWAVTAAAAAAPAAGGCSGDRLEALAPAMARLADADEIELASWAGGLAEIGSVAPSLAAEIDAALGAAPGSPHCAAVGVVLPAGARFSGFQYEVAGVAGLAPCLPDRDCDGGAGRWLGPPRIERGPNAIVLYGLFENLGTAPATAYLTVYFAPPTAGWQPGEP